MYLYFTYFFTKTYVVGTHLKCLTSNEYLQHVFMEKICCGTHYSMSASNEYPQHMVSWRNNKIIYSGYIERRSISLEYNGGY